MTDVFSPDRAATAHPTDLDLLRARLQEAEETLRAIRLGEVDALVVKGPQGPRTYTLVTADQAYRKLVEQMNEGALTLSIAGQILYANQRFATIIGKPLTAVAGHPLVELASPELQAALETLLAFEGDSAAGTFELLHTDGHAVPVHVSIARLAHETFQGLCAVVTDLTESHRRARALEMEHAARISAEAANQAKSDFLAVMSHELRTPLNAVRGYADLMITGTHGPLSPEYAGFVRRIQTSALHLQALIEAVLGYAKLESGRTTYDVTTTSLLDLLNAVETLVLPQADEKGVRFIVRACEPHLAARCDPEKAAQILINLASNAVKFTPRGGEVEMSLAVTDTTYDLAVSDTGPGIPDNQLERIFEPFVQWQTEGANRPAGVGLGLAISRELSRAMGGDVLVTSKQGVGSRFTFRLPRPA